MPTYSLTLGAVLPGDLIVQEQLGEHAFCAMRKRDGRELAVRIIPARSPALIRNSLELAEAASGIRHPVFANVEAFGRLEDGAVFIASELVRGPTLLTWRQQNTAPEAALLVELLRSLHDALAEAARAAVVHDAIEPRHLRLQLSAAESSFKLLELGIPAPAFQQPRDALAQCFMAPEEIAALQTGDDSFRCSAAMNVYACGSLLYYLAAGAAPDEALSSPALPANLRSVIKRARAKEPRDRFVSVAELDAALAASTRSVSQRASHSDASGMRVSGMGVAPIGLRSSSPPELLSAYPPDDEAHDSGAEHVADSSSKEAPEEPQRRSARLWWVLPAAAAACLALLVMGRNLLAPHAPANQGALVPQAAHEGERENTTPAPGLPLTARVQIREIQVHGGSLPAALVRRAAVRLQSQFKRCYEQSARAAGYNSFGELSVNLQLDTQGHARSAHVEGANLPQLDACITAGVANLHSERPNDTDNMLASFKIAFTP
jgi:hypothetical protein